MVVDTVGITEGIRLLVDEALRVARIMGDRTIVVTVWTAQRGPSVAEREQLHVEMQRKLGAGFVGTMGWEG